jgi:hypothetical protein
MVLMAEEDSYEIQQSLKVWWRPESHRSGSADYISDIRNSATAGGNAVVAKRYFVRWCTSMVASAQLTARLANSALCLGDIKSSTDNITTP